jgi:hypothetical protein
MKHYVVSYTIDYEGSVILGVFNTLKKAKKCFAEQEEKRFGGNYIFASEISIVLWQGEKEKLILEETYEKWRIKNV